MARKSGNVTAAGFAAELNRRFENAQAAGQMRVEVTAGDLHRSLHAANRIPLCCNVMYDMENLGDSILTAPSGGAGPGLLISYAVPRIQLPDFEMSIYEPKAVLSGYEMRMVRFADFSQIHPLLKGLEALSREKKSETATKKLCQVTADIAECICRQQKIRIDNTGFGTICGAIGQKGILSEEALYALDFLRILHNAGLHRGGSVHVMTTKTFSYASYAFEIFLGEVIQKGLLRRREGDAEKAGERV